MALVDPWEVRTVSIKQAERLGYPTYPNLPLLEKPTHIRSEDEIFARMMCAFIASACAFGVDKGEGQDWLTKEGFADALTAQEAAFLNEENPDESSFQNRVEALYVLAWSLGYVRRMDYHDQSDQDFVQLFPNLRTGQTATLMRAKSKPRSSTHLFRHLDLAHCLSWAIQEAEKQNKKPPGDLHPQVVFERKRALEWLLGEADWDSIEPSFNPDRTK